MPKNNVNPDHYKVAGRERRGEDILQAEQKETLARSRATARSASRTRVPAAPEVTRAVRGTRKSVKKTS
jgi:hypothetical protein